MGESTTSPRCQHLPRVHRLRVHDQSTLEFRGNSDRVRIVDPKPHLDAVADSEAASAAHRARQKEVVAPLRRLPGASERQFIHLTADAKARSPLEQLPREVIREVDTRMAVPLIAATADNAVE